MVKAVFFDAAGTLFESREPIGRSYARLARDFGVSADEHAVASAFRRAFTQAPALAFGPRRPSSELRRLEREWWRQRVADTFSKLGRFIDFDAYFDRLFSFFADPANWVAAPELPGLLQRLRDSGRSLGVISNFDYRLYLIMDGLGLRRYFDSITISSEAGFAKPSPEVFRVAIAKHRVSPHEAIHVGDSEPLDVQGAQAAGLRAILLDRTGTDHPQSCRETCIASLEKVLEIAQD